MSQALLYVRSRRIGWVVLVLAGSAIAGLVWARIAISSGDFARRALHPIVVMVPLLMALAITVSAGSPSAELEATGPRRVSVITGIHVLILFTIATSVVVPVGHPEMEYSVTSLIRNLMGFLGLGLLANVWIGPRWGWMVSAAYGVFSFALASASEPGIFGWPMQSDDDLLSLATGTFLFAAGIWALFRGWDRSLERFTPID